MNPEKIREIVDRIPFTLLIGAYLLYLGFGYYTFETDPGSTLMMKKAEIEETKKRKETLVAKLKVVRDFMKVVDQKKAEVRNLASELQNSKDAIRETIDLGSFMKSVITEAKKVGLTVQAVLPQAEIPKEYYVEHPFKVKVSGVYIQMVAFLDRLANSSLIVRVDNFEMGPTGAQDLKYVELASAFEIRTYRYLGTKADGLGKGDVK